MTKFFQSREVDDELETKKMLFKIKFTGLQVYIQRTLMMYRQEIINLFSNNGIDIIDIDDNIIIIPPTSGFIDLIYKKYATHTKDSKIAFEIIKKLICIIINEHNIKFISRQVVPSDWTKSSLSTYIQINDTITYRGYPYIGMWRLKQYFFDFVNARKSKLVEIRIDPVSKNITIGIVGYKL